MNQPKSALSIEDLLAETSQGDRAAFHALYRHSKGQLFGVILRIVRRRDLAEDVRGMPKACSGRRPSSRHRVAVEPWRCAMP